MRKIPLCIPYIGQEEKNAVNEVIESGWYAHGPKNHEFEEGFADYLGVKHALSMNSCTSAIHLAVEGLGITGEVILPSFTFVASANAVITGGARPVFADIEYDTCNIDPASIERLITPETQAIMPVHFGGQSANMTAVMEIAEAHNLFVIEDSAETIGGEHHNRLTGTFGVGCFSFYPTKNLTTGEGGMLTTDDDDLARKVKTLLAHGIDKSTYEREDQDKSWYRSARDISDIKPPVEKSENKHVYQMYTIRVGNGVDRDVFVRKLNAKGIGASIHFFPPVHHMEPYRGDKYYQDDLSVTEQVIQEIVTLPMYPQMTDDDLEYMVVSIKEVLSELS